jgi:hypothetical protein
VSLQEIEIAYIAGLVDGEGSIGVSASSHSLTNYRIKLDITMCDRQAIDFAASVFGGKVVQLKHKTSSGKAIYSWVLWCQKAANVLEQLIPYLLIKRDRAQKAVQLARMMKRANAAIVREGGSIDLVSIRHAIAGEIRSANFTSNGRIALAERKS